MAGWRKREKKYALASREKEFPAPTGRKGKGRGGTAYRSIRDGRKGETGGGTIESLIGL